MKVATVSEDKVTTCTPAEAREAWQSFLRAYKLVKDRLDRELSRVAQLSLTEIDVLWVVKVAGGRLRYIELAKRVYLSQSRISRQIEILEQKGFLTKDVTEKDRRATFAVLTPAGQKILDDTEEPLFEAWHRHFLQHIPAGELKTFTNIMASLIEEHGRWIYEAEGKPGVPVLWEPPQDPKRKKPSRTK